MPSPIARRVAVLRGGPRGDYSISMANGAVYLDILKQRSDLTTVDVIVTKQQEWLVYGVPRRPADILPSIDYTFIAINGIGGEDGYGQRLLSRYGVKYAGSGHLASVISLNKCLAKEVVIKSGLQSPDWTRVNTESKNLTDIIHTADSMFGSEFIVKPTFGSSRHGVTCISGMVDLLHRLPQCLSEYRDVMIEKFVPGITVNCGVIEGFRGQELYTTPVMQINENQECIEQDELKIATHLEESVRSAVRSASLQVHKALGLSFPNCR